MQVNQLTFLGKEQAMVVFNRQAMRDVAFSFYYCDGTEFDFPGFSYAYLTVYNSRNTQVVKEISGMIRTSNYLIANVSESDMIFEVNGDYWYEMGYVQEGGYEVVLQYGKFRVI